MKTHGIYLTVIVILALALFAGWKTLEKNRAEIIRLTDNFDAIIQDTTEKAAQYRVSKKELDKISPATNTRVKEIEKAQRGKVKEIHDMGWLASSVVHDTVFTENGLCCERQVWEFPHGCVTNVVTYDPLNMGITDSLFGEIEITRYVINQKPSFWKRLHDFSFFSPAKWPTSVRVENNCGLQIKENTIFEIQ